MDDTPRRTRREWLATCATTAGTATLAGCSGTGEESEPASTDGPRRLPGWAMDGADLGNTRHRPDDTGPEDGVAVAWENAPESPGYARPEPVVVDGSVYVGTTGDTARAIDAETGDPEWETPLESGVWSSPLVTGDVVYVLATVELYALDRADGTVNWSLEVPGGREANLTTDGSGLYVVASGGTGITRIDPDERENRNPSSLSTPTALASRSRSPVAW